MITVAVEGATDAPFVRKLCAEAGFETVGPLLVCGGTGELRKQITWLSKQGQRSPTLVVRDLDDEAPCAPQWIASEAPVVGGEFFALRIAVRSIEAWFLADTAHAAKRLLVKESKITDRPDELPYPKRHIVDLAHGSSSTRVKKQIVPERGRSRPTAAAYESWLVEGAEAWSPARAAQKSPSLARALLRLREMRARVDG